MKLKINSKQLYNKLLVCSKAISTKNTMPILDCFKFRVKDNWLYISSFDSETRISTKIELIESDGNIDIALDAKIILDSLKMLPDQPIELNIDADSKKVIIIYQNGEYSFIGQDGSDFPNKKALSTDYNTISINAEQLSTVLDKTIFASADDELRPVMTGVYFDGSQDKINFVASDGHKLVRLISNQAKIANPSSFILPKKPINIIRSILGKLKDDLIIKFDLTHAVFTVGDFVISTRFIEGRFPNYNSVIPSSSSLEIILNRSSLIGMVRRASVYSNKSTNLVRLTFNDNKLKVSCQDIDFSTAAEELMNIEWDRCVFSIGFKSTFLLEILESIDSDNVLLKLNEPSKAALLCPTEYDEFFDSTYLLMPIMLND